MSERNKVVEFPSIEALRVCGDFENYLRLAGDGDMFSYAELPKMLVAPAIETYGNWLADLTQKDPKHRERGSTPYFDRRKGDSLVFPVNPQVGDDIVIVVFPKNPSCIPSGFMHSHPDASCFSGCNGDLESFLDDLLPFEHVATAENNYLLVRTSETLCMGKYDLLVRGMWEDEDVQEITRMHTEANQCGTGLSRKEFKPFALRAQWLLRPTDFNYFYQTDYLPPLINLFCAKKYKYGFYCSQKDGIYRRWGREEVARYITDLLRRELLQERTPVGNGHCVA